jgi:hypothetical protein
MSLLLKVSNRNTHKSDKTRSEKKGLMNVELYLMNVILGKDTDYDLKKFQN